MSDKCGTPQRDRDIRPLLHRCLEEKHVNVSTAAIIHELEIPRPSARIDIALVNGLITGYEIKGGSDTLARLSNQEPSFSSVFERMTLVTSERHLNSARLLIPSWWGILEVTQGHTFVSRRRSGRNPSLKLENLLHIFTKVEIIRLEKALGALGGARERNKVSVIADILGSSPANKILSSARDLLKQRVLGGSLN